MLGVTSGIRDGKDQHGIAFGSKMQVAKTGGSDTQSHGPFHDYVYWHTANKALVDAGARSSTAVGALSSRRLTEPALTVWDAILEPTATSPTRINCLAKTAPAPRQWRHDPQRVPEGPGVPVFLLQEELFGRRHSIQSELPRTFRNGTIWDAIKDSGTVNVRSAGNNDWSNPYYRPAYPLFNPWAENQWVAVGGVQPPTATSPEYSKQFGFNRRGSPNGSPCLPLRTTFGPRAALVIRTIRTQAARRRQRPLLQR